MSESLDNGHELELRDATGRSLGVFVSNRVVQELTAERDRLRAELERVRQETQALAERVAKQDEKLAAFTAALQEYITFTPEELADLEKNGESLTEFIERMEREFGTP
jgi:hypothetical protein